jgi:hypothetical protein
VDLPLGEGPRFAAWDGSAAAGLRAWFERLEFRSLVARLDSLVRTLPGLAPPE